MKRLAAWLLLLLYLNASAQTLLPMVKDVLAHTFFWHEHLEHVHHGHHDSHHVHDEMATLAKQSDQNDPHSHPLLSFCQDVLSAHLIPATYFQATDVPDIRIALNVSWLFPFQETVYQVFVPPPERL